MSSDYVSIIIERLTKREDISCLEFEKIVDNFQINWSAQVLFDISKEYFTKGDLKRASYYNNKSLRTLENL